VSEGPEPHKGDWPYPEPVAAKSHLTGKFRSTSYTGVLTPVSTPEGLAICGAFNQRLIVKSLTGVQTYARCFGALIQSPGSIAEYKNHWGRKTSLPGVVAKVMP
jgi:hypothetical protein